MAENTEDTLNYWKESFWLQKDIPLPWHQTTPHPKLLKYADKFLVKAARVLVPLCGKTLDLKWLYENGYEVVGVEGTEFAIEEFFKDTKLEFSKAPYGDGGLIYQTPDKRLTILRTNFFTLSDANYVATFDSVWDRAALVAVLPEHRRFFAASVKRLAKPSFKCVSVVTEFDESKVEGPPYSVDQEEISNLYGECATITKLDTISIPPNTDEYINEPLNDLLIKANTPLYEGVYLISRSS